MIADLWLIAETYWRLSLFVGAAVVLTVVLLWAQRRISTWADRHVAQRVRCALGTPEQVQAHREEMRHRFARGLLEQRPELARAHTGAVLIVDLEQETHDRYRMALQQHRSGR